MTGPLLSLITAVDPARADHLAETAASVRAAAETAGPGQLEWLICVDGPPGPVNPTVRSTISDVGGVLVWAGSHSGVAAARNRLLVEMTGQLALTLDADDLLHPAVVPALADVEHRHADAAAFAGAQAGLIGTATAGDVRVAAPPVPTVFAPGDLPDAWTSPFWFHPGQVAYRRDALLAAGGWPALAGGEDRALVLTVAVTGSIVVTSIPMTTYRLWDGQTTAGTAYQTGKPAYERLTWLLIDARLRAARGTGLPGDVPRRPTPPDPAA